MPIAQIIFILFIVFAISRVIVRFRAKEISAGMVVFWLLFWVGVGTIILIPSITQKVAEHVGVGRGVDLVLYISVLTLFYLVFRVLVRLERIDKEITTIVREIALWDGKRSK